MKILITGGCGFLGSSLAERLVDMKEEVTLFVRETSCKKNIYPIINKLRVETNLVEAVKNQDVIFHFAGETDPDKSKDLEDLKLINSLLEICKEHNPTTKIIFTSSVTISNGDNFYESHDKDDFEPLTFYDLNKLYCEFCIKMFSKLYGLNYCILRLANIIGEKQSIDNPRRGVLNYLINEILHHKKIKLYGGGEMVRDYSYVENFIDAFILAIGKNTDRRIFTLGSGDGHSLKFLIEKINEITTEKYGIEAEWVSIPFPDGTNPISKRNFIADNIQFRSATGWEPRISLKEGLTRTIESIYQSKMKDYLHDSI